MQVMTFLKCSHHCFLCLLKLLKLLVSRLKDIESGSGSGESDDEEEDSRSSGSQKDSPEKIKGRRIVTSKKVAAVNKSGQTVRKARSVVK